MSGNTRTLLNTSTYLFQLSIPLVYVYKIANRLRTSCGSSQFSTRRYTFFSLHSFTSSHSRMAIRSTHVSIRRLIKMYLSPISVVLLHLSHVISLFFVIDRDRQYRSLAARILARIRARIQSILAFSFALFRLRAPFLFPNRGPHRQNGSTRNTQGRWLARTGLMTYFGVTSLKTRRMYTHVSFYIRYFLSFFIYYTTTKKFTSRFFILCPPVCVGVHMAPYFFAGNREQIRLYVYLSWPSLSTAYMQVHVRT